MTSGANGHGPGEEVRATAARVREAGPALGSASEDRLCASLAATCARLLDPDEDLRQDLGLLPASTGLSPEMVAWALDATLGPASSEASWRGLMAQAVPPAGRRAIPRPASLVGVLLAGNVFTAALRGLLTPLVARAPVVAKASSRESIFPRLLERTLQEVDPELGAALGVVVFPGGPSEMEDALLRETDVVAVFGGNRTVSDLRHRLPPTTRLVVHGHGLGAAFVPRSAVSDLAAAERVVHGLAIDVAAYDQRGCLSPQAVLVEEGGAVSPRELAAMLAEVGLGPLSDRLPRGRLPPDVGAAQIQWRGVAAMRDALFEGDGFSAAFEGNGPIRLGPGYRNIGVHAVASVADIAGLLRPIARHLKILGVAGGAETMTAVLPHLPEDAAPAIADVGRMQRPDLGAVADGLPPFEGIVRFVELPADDG